MFINCQALEYLVHSYTYERLLQRIDLGYIASGARTRYIPFGKAVNGGKRLLIGSDTSRIGLNNPTIVRDDVDGADIDPVVSEP